ncbi:MAG: thioredoxin domain-containing protein [Nitrospirae bacterium]|nr:thioredoxin domain-containing protein [Nitrospirota bacterium]
MKKLVCWAMILIPVFMLSGCANQPGADKEAITSIQNTQKEILAKVGATDKETLDNIQNTQKEILVKLDAIEKKMASAPAAAPMPPAPDFNKVYNIPIGNSPVNGNKKAPVTIVEFSDFQCPYCAQLQPTLKEVLIAYPKDVRLVFKQYPLPFHAQARNASKASLAAGEQGKFWEMHDLIFENFSQLGEDKFRELAGKIGLNVEKFMADYQSNKYDQQIELDMNTARSVGVTGTPTLFINGKRVMRRSVEDFKDTINNILKEKGN